MLKTDANCHCHSMSTEKKIIGRLSIVKGMQHSNCTGWLVTRNLKEKQKNVHDHLQTRFIC